MAESQRNSVRNIKTAFFINLGFTIVEISGGIYVNRVAIVSDAIHDLGDSMALGTAWFLQLKSRQAPNKRFSFGYKRFSLLGALITGLVLITGSMLVIVKAIDRIQHPEESNANGMLVFAIIGIAVNGYAAWKLSKGRSYNERMVSWHMLEDVLGWSAVLIVSVILQFKTINYLDPALSLIITLYILWNVVRRLRSTILLFLQGSPDDIDQNAIETEILDLDLTENIHHTHIWSLDGEHHVFSTHIRLKKLDNLAQLSQFKEDINEVLSKYRFEHITVDTELNEENCHSEHSDPTQF